MGGPEPAVLLLGALSVLSRAVLPGFAQDVSTNQSLNFGTEVPAATTVSSVVTSAVLHDSSSVVSEFSDVTGDGKHNETIAVTEPAPPELPSTIAVTGTAAITEEPQESNGSSAGTAASQAYTASRGATGPNVTQPPPTTHTPTATVTEAVTTGTAGTLTERPLLPSTPSAQTRSNTETPPDPTQPAATTTALHNEQTPAATTTTYLPVTTAVTSAQPTSPATQTAATPRTSRPEEVRDPSQLEVGGHKDNPDFHSGSSNPLFVMIVSVFTIMVVMVVVAVGFHRYKKRNRRTDFRRLQDLPMDDMMEDTPLALYSY